MPHAIGIRIWLQSPARGKIRWPVFFQIAEALRVSPFVDERCMNDETVLFCLWYDCNDGPNGSQDCELKPRRPSCRQLWQWRDRFAEISPPDYRADDQHGPRPS